MSDERNERLRGLLRAGDPATGDPGLDRGEQAAIRERMLRAAGERRGRPAGWLLPAGVAAALFALTLGLAWRAAPPRDAVARRPADPPPASEARQIQFTTDRGTLVVWVLQPRNSS